MDNRDLKKAISALLILASTLTSTSCGNSWITASEREQTLAALMSKAEYAYDKGQFEESENLFRQALDKDPTYSDARIKLSYATNAVAGLSILDFVLRFVVKDESDSSSTGNSSNSLSIFTETVGPTDEEAARIREVGYQSIAELRTQSAYFAKLHDSWQTICPLVSEEVFETVFSQAPDQLKDRFGMGSCQNGLGSGEKQSSAATFSAALQFMAQAATLFQTGLDTNGDNEIDLAASGLKAIQELQNLQNFSTNTDPASVDATEYANNLSAISNQLDTIQNLKSQIDGEIVTYALTCFTFISALVARIPNIPTEVSRKIERAISKINEGQAKLIQYTSFESGSSDSSQGAKVKEAAEKAAATIDELYNKVNELPDGADKDQRLAELDKQKERVCQNFEETKTDFNLPSDVTTPSQCVAILFNGSKSQNFDSHNTQNNQLVNVYSGVLRPIPLPSELNSSLALTDPAQSGVVSDHRIDFLNFIRFGGSLRK